MPLSWSEIHKQLEPIFSGYAELSESDQAWFQGTALAKKIQDILNDTLDNSDSDESDSDEYTPQNVGLWAWLSTSIKNVFDKYYESTLFQAKKKRIQQCTTQFPQDTTLLDQKIWMALTEKKYAQLLECNETACNTSLEKISAEHQKFFKKSLAEHSKMVQKTEKEWKEKAVQLELHAKILALLATQENQIKQLSIMMQTLYDKVLREKLIQYHAQQLQAHAQLIQLVLNAEIHEKNDIVHLEQWSIQYEQNFKKLLKESFNLPDMPTSYESSTKKMFSWISQSQPVKATVDFMNELADVHAFIQYTGFATQNETSYMAMLDVINYQKHKQTILEARGIIASLLRLFSPLYEEYQEIAKFENNGYKRALRAMLPICIIALFVVGVLTPLAIFGAPEIALLFLLIPTIFLGGMLANQYIRFKNFLHQKLRTWYYGGEYQIPEFQMNPRLQALFPMKAKNPQPASDDLEPTAAFSLISIIRRAFQWWMPKIFSVQNSDPEPGADALFVQALYIQALKHRKAQRLQYTKMPFLTDSQLKAQQDNDAQIKQLLSEWYNIHNNPLCSQEEVYNIVLQRVALQYKENNEILNKVFHQDITNFYQDTTKKVQEILGGTNAIPTVTNKSDDQKPEEKATTFGPTKENFATFWVRQASVQKLHEIHTKLGSDLENIKKMSTEEKQAKAGLAAGG
ncbi:MAG: hypothetical protein Q8R79_04725 [Legionellaceae bacterium]|nr:hypothetical protein [Legionellaceae bacterium]